MFPIKDDNPSFSTPIVTLGLIGACLYAWVEVQGLGRTEFIVRSLCEQGLIPGDLLGRIPTGYGFELAAGVRCVIGDGIPWQTLFSHMFLHGGWMHLLGNLWFLWIFGNNVEDSMGHARFLVFYLLCGLAAATLQIVSAPSSSVPMVGASGAIGGVMGAYIVLYPRVWVHMLLFFGFFFTRVAVPAYFMLGYWLLIQLVGGYFSIGADGGGTAFWAHVGGFVCGAALVSVFKDPELLRRHPYYGWRQAAVHRGYFERLDRRR